MEKHQMTDSETLDITDDSLEFDLKYRLDKQIGRGGYGTVYSAYRLSDNVKVAVKHISKARVQSWGQLGDRFFPKEVCALVHLRKTDSVIDLYDCYENENAYLIVLEFPNYTMDLFDFINMKGPLGENVSRQIFRKVVTSLQECETLGVIHRDIKDENILVDPVTLDVKLIDLGSAVFVEEDELVPFDGTGVYAPPELLVYGMYSSAACTAWSLGILLYNMLVGDIPFHTFSEICEIRVTFPPYLHNSEAKDLVLSCLQRDPDLRIKPKDILQHPWMEKQFSDLTSADH